MTSTEQQTVQHTAEEALKAFALDHGDAVGFAYTPTSAPWFRLKAGTATGRDGKPVHLDGAFELRAFDSDSELRWWNVPGEGGHAYAINQAVPGLTVGDRYSRLLWGQVRERDAENGWVCLFEARIGPLWVPFAEPIELDARVALDAVEYWEKDDDGNVFVADERLVGLTKWESNDKS